MKILAVRFKNINSLRGDHYINFRESRFADSGLFAITGNTGAGKTSILDAITLGLYGNAPRFNTERPLEIMSYHTAECWSEVDFEVKDKEYRCRWGINRARGKVNGEIQQPRMYLKEIETDKTLEDNVTGTKKHIADLTGLDYPRFLRSVMLAQGDFAAFLRADEKMRGELLEKITGTDIYSQISRKAHDKYREEKHKLEHFESRLGNSSLLSEAQKQDYHTQLLSFQQEEKQWAEQLESLTAQLQWTKRIAQLRSRHAELEILRTAVIAEKELHRDDFDRLALFEKASPFADALSRIDHAQQLIRKFMQEATALTKELPELEKQTQNLRTQQETDQQTLSLLQQEYETLQPVLEQVALLDADLKNLRDEFKKYHDENELLKKSLLQHEQDYHKTAELLKTYEQQHGGLSAYLQIHVADAQLPVDLPLINEHIKTLAGVQEEINGQQQVVLRVQEKGRELSTQLTELEKHLEGHQSVFEKIEKQILETEHHLSGLLGDAVFEDLEKQYSAQSSSVLLQEQVVNIARSHQAETAKEKQLVSDLEICRDQLEQENAQLATLKEKTTAAAEKLELLQKIYEQQRLIKNYEHERANLRAGEPCVLCGSMVHPFALHLDPPQPDQAALECEEQKKLLRSLHQQHEEKTRAVNQLEIRCEQKIAVQQQVQKQLASLQNDFASFTKRITLSLDIHQVEEITAGFEAQKIQLLQLTEKVSLCRKEQQQISELRIQHTATTGQVHTAEKQVQEVKNNLQATRKEYIQLQESIADLQRRATIQQDALRQLISPYAQTLPAAPASLLGELQQRADHYQQTLRKTAHTEQELIAGRAALEKFSSLQAQIAQQVQKSSHELEHLKQKGIDLKQQRIAIFGEKQPLQEKEKLTSRMTEQTALLRQSDKKLSQLQEQLVSLRRLIADKEQSVRHYQSVLEAENTRLVPEIAAQGFAGLSALQNALSPQETVATLRTRCISIDKKLAEAESALSENEHELKTQEKKALTTSLPEELAVQLSQTEIRRREAIDKIATLNHQLKENEALEQKYASLQLEIRKQQQETSRWKKLSDIVGTEHTNKFRVFAQSLTLARLVQLANRHLSKLNPRYQLQRKPQTDLELEIIDCDQADNVRSMQTLSGGETFLASLALALGLSDLAGRQTRIDSLFIDEGFGTLDADTLSSVLATLESLQASGKMIGIISHVEALKDNIVTQIQVKKTGSGISILEIKPEEEEMD